MRFPAFPISLELDELGRADGTSKLEADAFFEVGRETADNEAALAAVNCDTVVNFLSAETVSCVKVLIKFEVVVIASEDAAAAFAEVTGAFEEDLDGVTGLAEVDAFFDGDDIEPLFNFAEGVCTPCNVVSAFSEPVIEFAEGDCTSDLCNTASAFSV